VALICTKRSSFVSASVNSAPFVVELNIELSGRDNFSNVADKSPVYCEKPECFCNISMPRKI
jgi:hypothetical protein